MIGNDVIDLHHTPVLKPDRLGRLMDKVFSDEEKQFLQNSSDLRKTIWLFWSMKESAYKAHFQHYKKRFFHPSKLECRPATDGRGMVIVQDQLYFTSSSIRPDHIHTVARSERTEKIYSDLLQVSAPVYTVQHKKAYRAAIHAYSKFKKIPERTLHIQKDHTGVPRIFDQRKRLPVSLSISHHGKYCAFAFTVI